MASSDRAINFPLRVTGVAEAAQAFKSVGEAATKSIGDVAKAAAAQAQYEAAVVRAHSSSAVLGAAQAQANQQLSAAKAAFAGGTMSAEAYATANLDVKNSLALVKAEQASATAGLKNSSTALVAAKNSAAGLSPALIVAGKSARQTRAGFQQLGFQINDVTTQLSMGTPAMQVFAQQSGQVLQSVNLMTGGAGKFATIMGGPWGIALTLGVSLLGLFSSKLFESGDAIEKETEKLQQNARETEATRLAKALFAHTEEGVTQAIYDQKDALDKQIAALQTEAERSLQAAKSNLAEEITIRDKTKALLAQAIAYEALYTSSLRNQLGAEGAPGFDIAAGEASARRSDLEARSAKEDAAVATAKSNLANWQSLVSVEAGSRTEADKIKRTYEGPGGLIELARKRAVAEGKVGDQLERQVNLLKKEEAAKLKALSDRGGGETDSRTKTQVWQEFHDALAQRGVVQAAGATGFRTAEQQNAQFKAGLSPLDGYKKLSRHQTWEAFDPTRKSFNEESARAAANQVGLKGFKVVAESRDRKHFEWTGHQRGPDVAGSEQAQRAAEASARKAEAQRAQAIRRAQQFADAIAGADNSLLDARRANVHEAAQLAAIDRQDVATAREKSINDIAAKEASGEYSKLQADQLREKADQTAAERLITIDTREAQRIADEKLQLSEGEIGLQREMLDGQMALAKTANERRAIQLQLLELDKQSEKLALDAVIADQAATAAAKAVAAARLRNLDSIYGDRRQATLQQTAGPGESYIRDLNRTPAQMNEALEQVKVNGLKSLNDGLVDAITNFRSLGDVEQNVLRSVLRDLVAMEVEKYITAPLAKKLFPEQAATVANDNAAQAAAQLAAAGGEMIAAGVSLTSSAAVWTATAMQIQLAAAALAASGGGSAGGGGGGGGDPLGMLFDAVLGYAGGGTSSSLNADVTATIAANPGVFAAGTDMLPIGKPFFVGENGREKMINRGGGRVEVINGPRTHRAAQEGGGGVTIVQNNYIPERVDPRRTADGIARSTQGALARAHRKGLAMTRGRN